MKGRIVLVIVTVFVDNTFSGKRVVVIVHVVAGGVLVTTVYADIRQLYGGTYHGHM